MLSERVDVLTSGLVNEKIQLKIYHEFGSSAARRSVAKPNKVGESGVLASGELWDKVVPGTRSESDARPTEQLNN
jgi:hypothetical protein